MLGLQGWIHKLEEGDGVRFVKAIAAALSFLALVLLYNSTNYQNFSRPEAMDAAQVARNIAEGNGYTTEFVRPLSVYLLEKNTGNARLDAHPDLANAPAYPYLLAGLMRWLPFKWTVDHADKSKRYQPEEWIARFNQVLFFLVLLVTFRLAKYIFDDLVAWLSVLVLGGAELIWRLSVSGLPNLFLMLVLLLVAWCLAVAERGAREKEWGLGRLAWLALAAGALTGIAGLTLYACGLLIIPVVAYFGYAFAQRKGVLGFIATVGFIVVMLPWIARNHSVSGTLYGTAGYAAYEDSDRFPGNRLERALNPVNLNTPVDIGKYELGEHWGKFLKNGVRILQEDLPKLGGSWLSAFFLVGLLVPFKSQSLSRLRIFVVSSLFLLFVAQALGRTHLSGEGSEVTSENLLVALVPLVFIFGAGLFVMLLEQWEFTFVPTRNLVITVFCGIVCLPLIVGILNPRRGTLAYPPYYPPFIQETGNWMEKQELMMSDIPWAVAWYGNRQCVWLTWDIANDYAAVHEKKNIHALYLTQLTMDRKILSEMIKGDEPVWGRFAVESIAKEEVPAGFPLKHAFGDWFPEQLFLSDRARWEKKK